MDYKTYALNGDFTPDLHQTYQFFINTGDQNYAQIAEARSVAGFRANLRLQNNPRFFRNLWSLENFTLKFEYQKRNFLDPSRAENDYFSLQLAATSYRLSLALKASQLITEDYTLTKLAFFTTYLFSYNIPTVARKETGVIEGQVFGGRTPGIPLPNVIVTTNEISVLTNKEGKFVFSSLPPGVYTISIDKSRAALDLVPGEKLPLFVEVKKGETTKVRIDLFPGAGVTGKTLIKVMEGENGLYLPKPPAGIPQRNGIKETKALPNILVELSNGAETFRQVTPGNGEFSFTGLRPGRWTLKVYEENLPAHYYFETAEVQLNLEPGVTKEFIFAALPRIRGVQIVDEGALAPGKPMIPADRRLGLEDLFAAEYYDTAASPKTLQRFLEETGLLQKNYLYHDRYFTDIIYKVKEGDSLTGIAEKFNIPLQRIIDLNFLGTTGVVEAGTILIIPVPTEFIYTVAPGETLAEIAKKHGTTVEILLNLNNIDPSAQLQSGELLVLPGY